MNVLLYLRKGITPARFMTSLGRQIRSGEHKAWEILSARPLTVRHKGRFKSVVTFKPPPKRLVTAHPPAHLVASLTGKDAGLVLRYFVGLVTMKLGAQVEGFYVPID